MGLLKVAIFGDFCVDVGLLGFLVFNGQVLFCFLGEVV